MGLCSAEQKVDTKADLLVAESVAWSAAWRAAWTAGERAGSLGVPQVGATAGQSVARTAWKLAGGKAERRDY